MATVKLTVRRLYRLQDERMVNAQATARIYVGDTLIASEEIGGITESPVSKYLHHQLSATLPVRVEWDCNGIADMTVTDIALCPCCQHDGHE
ncbi:hypothetical protein [Duffyella gerundensis]|uniref:hypothetical protein n=1 Tax=Duffyella gerundensis TaxID=1619313 RepID=UPI001CE25939|nr:hypothetical protein [Duffyella gerundensis]